MAGARQQIAAIDRQIDALRKAEPSILARMDRECELFRQRGVLQLERDEIERRAAAAAKRWATRLANVKCPTCGHHTLAA